MQQEAALPTVSPPPAIVPLSSPAAADDDSDPFGPSSFAMPSLEDTPDWSNHGVTSAPPVAPVTVPVTPGDSLRPVSHVSVSLLSPAPEVSGVLAFTSPMGADKATFQTAQTQVDNVLV